MCGYRHPKTNEKEHAMPKKPLRSQEQVPIRFSYSVAERLRQHSHDLGMSVSEYLTDLVMGQTPVERPAASSQNVALALNRLVRAIGLFEAEGDRGETFRLLRECQHLIVAEQRGDAALKYKLALEARKLNQDQDWG
jgi:hypothetical protein